MAPRIFMGQQGLQFYRRLIANATLNYDREAFEATLYEPSSYQDRNKYFSANSGT